MEDRVRLLEKRDIDELIILDVRQRRTPRFIECERLCSLLFCPVTVGGGIRSLADFRRLLANGADKCSINTAAIDDPPLITQAAEKFGSQAVVVSIDVKDGKVVADCGTRPTQLDPVGWAKEVESRGAGEILLTVVERDGMREGYDLDLITEVCDAVCIPVIAAGGCGTYQHMQQALNAGAHAVASGAMFQFAEATPKEAARYLKEQGFETRV